MYMTNISHMHIQFAVVVLYTPGFVQRMLIVVPYKIKVAFRDAQLSCIEMGSNRLFCIYKRVIATNYHKRKKRYITLYIMLLLVLLQQSRDEDCGNTWYHVETKECVMIVSYNVNLKYVSKFYMII